MTVVSLTISMKTLNMNGLKHVFQRQRLSDQIKKQYSTIYYLQKIQFGFKFRNRLKVKGWRNIQQAKSSHKKAGVAKPISDNRLLKEKILMEIKKTL